MSFDSIRLETKGGDAPSFEWEPSFNNDATTNPLPGKRNQAQIFDLAQWTGEITIQGQFQPSENLPPAHRSALDSLFGGLPVSASDQADRAINKLVFDENVSAPYNLYLNDREFSANSPNSVDVPGGVFPNVSCTEIRTPEEAGLARNEFLFRFSVGFVSTSEASQ